MNITVSQKFFFGDYIPDQYFKSYHSPLNHPYSTVFHVRAGVESIPLSLRKSEDKVNIRKYAVCLPERSVQVMPDSSGPGDREFVPILCLYL